MFFHNLGLLISVKMKEKNDKSGTFQGNTFSQAGVDSMKQMTRGKCIHLYMHCKSALSWDTMYLMITYIQLTCV
jgi:hypothetical protein